MSYRRWAILSLLVLCLGCKRDGIPADGSTLGDFANFLEEGEVCSFYVGEIGFFELPYDDVNDMIMPQVFVMPAAATAVLNPEHDGWDFSPSMLFTIQNLSMDYVSMSSGCVQAITIADVGIFRSIAISVKVNPFQTLIYQFRSPKAVVSLDVQQAGIDVLVGDVLSIGDPLGTLVFNGDVSDFHVTLVVEDLEVCLDDFMNPGVLQEIKDLRTATNANFSKVCYL